jgi:hypothetical protein
MVESTHVIDALSLLRPFDVDVPKRRIGPNRDGGYVLCDILGIARSVMSYGISTEFSFDEEMADGGLGTFMFDHTIGRPHLKSSRMRFFQEGVAGTRSPDGRLDTIDGHISRFGIDVLNGILKMDVEGAEYAAILGASEQTLRKFSQIVFECHQLPQIKEERFRRTFVEVFSKLNRDFVIFHVHANNTDGPDPVSIEGLPVPRLLEVSMVRRDLVVFRPSRTVYPTDLDFPNTKKMEKLLWYFPFFPGEIDVDAFKRSFDRANFRQGAS